MFCALKKIIYLYQQNDISPLRPSVWCGALFPLGRTTQIPYTYIGVNLQEKDNTWWLHVDFWRVRSRVQNPFRRIIFHLWFYTYSSEFHNVGPCHVGGLDINNLKIPCLYGNIWQPRYLHDWRCTVEFLDVCPL